MGAQAKKRGSGRVKRQQIEADDGWTVITHGFSKVSLAKGNDNEQLTASLPNRVVKNLTSEKLLADFKTLQERWDDTALACQIEELTRKRNWDIKHAVCIGIGSFSRDWAHRWRSLWQLVLFIAVIHGLERPDQEGATKHKIEIWAQDPAFTDLDIEFLRHLDVQVTESGIEAHILTSSFVYSPFVDWFLLLPTFLCCNSSPERRNDPTLYIGNEILDDYTLYAQTEKKRERLNECNELGKAFLQKREMIKLKEFDLHAQALNGMVVYWMTNDN